MRQVCLSLVLFFSLGASASDLTSVGEPTRDALGKKLNVLVWNVYAGSDDLFTYDYPRLIEDRDLVLLQEANLSESMTTTLLSTDLGYTHARSFTSLVGKVKMGVATGSRVKPLRSTGLVSPVRELRSATRKAALVQEYQLSRSLAPLLVANVHGINFVPNADFLKHVEQIALNIASHAGPMLVGGDFNTWNVERLQGLDRIFGLIGLRRVSFPPGRKRFPNIGRLLGSQTGGDLDQVYVRGLTVTHTDVLTDVTSSDHKPLTLRLRLP